MTAVIELLGALLVASGIYNVAVLVVSVRFARTVRDRTPATVGDPFDVSVLVPLDGAEPRLFDHLAAYCRLEHGGSVQIVIGSLDPDDPALETARLVARRYPAADLEIVAGAEALGPNRKASLLAALSARARHAIIAVIDSDVLVPPDYLARVLPPLFRPGVGLVSCVYRAPGTRSLPQAYEALCINTDFCPSVLLASVLGRPDIALGASIVLRRETLDRVGGFPAVVEYLADDHRLGELVNSLGNRAALAPCVVESAPNPETFGAALRHQVRWARTVRACAPWGYFANIVTHGTTFSACALATAPRHPAMAVLALATTALRFAAAIAGTWSLGAGFSWTIALLPLRDFAATAIWCVSSTGNSIEWRGRYYRLGREGHLRDASDDAGWSRPGSVPVAPSDQRACDAAPTN
jgi:ceramide glucosyltransferase